LGRFASRLVLVLSFVVLDSEFNSASIGAVFRSISAQ
jgi:hypothetical protein